MPTRVSSDAASPRPTGGRGARRLSRMAATSLHGSRPSPATLNGAVEVVVQHEHDGPDDVVLVHELQPRVEAEDRRARGRSRAPG